MSHVGGVEGGGGLGGGVTFGIRSTRTTHLSPRQIVQSVGTLLAAQFESAPQLRKSNSLYLEKKTASNV